MFRLLLTMVSEAPQLNDEIAKRLRLRSSLVKHGLRLLRGARPMSTERKGKQMLYSKFHTHVGCVPGRTSGVMVLR